MVDLDEAVISVQSGDGGSGCVSFRRERFLPKGGPDGGNGGSGGSIVIRPTTRIQTLDYFRFRKLFKAMNGRPGRGKNQAGKDGEDLVIEVPQGTEVYDLDSHDLLADLVREDQEIVIPGGRGGKGNQHFATSTHRTPRFAQPGLPGQKRRLRLSLKYLADIGIIGLPNTGKSTLLSRLTTARPKIDTYPFTTLAANLGVISFDDERFLVIADIPGIIAGASQGKGLGHGFLKHIQRTKLLLHLLDITHIPEGDLLGDYRTLCREIEAYDPNLLEKKRIVLINKMDAQARGGRNAQEVREALGREGIEALLISALTGDGLEQLRLKLKKVFFNGRVGQG